MSYTKATRIQRAQLSWYRRYIGLSGLRQIRERTKPCPPDIHPDDDISIFLINELVPRGGSIEFIIKRWPKENGDTTRMAYNNAIMRGLI